MEGQRRDWVRDCRLVEVKMRLVRVDATAAMFMVFCGGGMVVVVEKGFGRWRGVLGWSGMRLESKEKNKFGG